MGWIGPMTYRQYRTWTAWLEAEWNRPGRLEHYLMRIAQRAQGGWLKNPFAATMEDQRVEFMDRDAPPTEGSAVPPSIMSAEMKAKVDSAIARSAWRARMGTPLSPGRRE